LTTKGFSFGVFSWGFCVVFPRFVHRERVANRVVLSVFCALGEALILLLLLFFLGTHIKSNAKYCTQGRVVVVFTESAFFFAWRSILQKKKPPQTFLSFFLRDDVLQKEYLFYRLHRFFVVFRLGFVSLFLHPHPIALRVLFITKKETGQKSGLPAIFVCFCGLYVVLFSGFSTGFVWVFACFSRLFCQL